MRKQLEASTSIETADLMSKVGSLQRAHQTSSATSIGAQTVPVPNPAGGDPLTSPAVPGLATFGLTDGRPDVQLAPFQTLVQRLNLQYDFANYSYLLSRAVNDMVNPATGDAMPTVLVGIPISFNPTSAHKDLVAEIRVRFRAYSEVAPTTQGIPPAKIEAPRVLTMIPQARTYNVQKIVRGSQAAGIGIVSTFLSFGANSLNQSDDLYLVQDYDLIALGGSNVKLNTKGTETPAEELQLTWQVRPVLANSTVEPGERMLMASLSVPKLNTHKLGVEVEVVWRPYNRKSRTVLSGLACLPDLPHSQVLDLNWTGVSPQLTTVRHAPIPKSDDVLVTLNGNGLMPDLDLYLQDQLLEKQEFGTTFHSFRIDQKRLVQDDIEFVGVNGFRQLLAQTLGGSGKKADYQFAANSVETEPGWSLLTLSVANRRSWCDLTETLNERALVMVGDEVYGLVDSELDWTLENGANVAKLYVPTGLMSAEPVITLCIPVSRLENGYPFRFQTQSTFAGQFDISSIEQLTHTKEFTNYAIKGRNLSKVEFTLVSYVKSSNKLHPFEQLKTILKSLSGSTSESSTPGSIQPVRTGSGSIVMLTVPTPLLENARLVTATLKPVGKEPFTRIISLPEPKAKKEEKPEPNIAIPDLVQYHEGLVPISGKFAKRVEKVMLGELELKVVPVGESFYLEIPARITAKPGTRTMLVKISPSKEKPAPGQAPPKEPKEVVMTFTVTKYEAKEGSNKN